MKTTANKMFPSTLLPRIPFHSIEKTKLHELHTHTTSDRTTEATRKKIHKAMDNDEVKFKTCTPRNAAASDSNRTSLPRSELDFLEELI